MTAEKPPKPQKLLWAHRYCKTFKTKKPVTSPAIHKTITTAKPLAGAATLHLRQLSRIS
jgi:hypothetical protein